MIMSQIPGPPIVPDEARVLVLIPAYNEELRISDVIAGVLRSLPVVVVDDGSTDKTSEVARAAGAAVLRQVPNQGKGTALRSGFRHAITTGYDAAITLDADGQHDPAEIPLFLDAYVLGRADLIIGKRDFKDIPGVRRLANWLGERVFTWALGQTVPDNQSGFRLLSRRLMVALVDSKEPGFEFELEMIVTCIRLGFELDWVPIRTIYAGESSHIRPWHHLSNFLRVAYQTRQTIRRPSVYD